MAAVAQKPVVRAAPVQEHETEGACLAIRLSASRRCEEVPMSASRYDTSAPTFLQTKQVGFGWNGFADLLWVQRGMRQGGGAEAIP